MPTISTRSRPAPIAPQRPAPQARPKPEVCRLRPDSFQVGRALPASLIEADVRLGMVGGTGLAADGTLTLQKTFLERLLRGALSGSKDIQDARIGFDAASGSYAVQAKVRVKGLQVPLSLKLAPVVDHNQLGFQLRDVAIATPLGSLEANLLTRKVTEAIAGELRFNGFTNSVDARQGIVRIDVDNLLSRLGVLPEFASVDLDRTRLSVDVQRTGNVVVGMKSNQHLPQLPDTPASDIAVFADPKALQQALRGALGPDYEVQQVTLDNGHLKLDGQAEFKQGSDFFTGAKALLLLLAVASGDPAANRISPTRERFMVPLALDIQQDGTQLVITPSLSKALGSLKDSLEKAGLKPVQDGKGLRVDLNSVWKDKCATFDQVRVQPEGTSARMRMDLDSFYDTPWLKADVNG